jgi:hypothetical protein
MILLVITFLLGLARKGWLSPLVPLTVSAGMGVLSALKPDGGPSWIQILTAPAFISDMLETAIFYFLAYAAGFGIRAVYDGNRQAAAPDPASPDSKNDAGGNA